MILMPVVVMAQGHSGGGGGGGPGGPGGGASGGSHTTHDDGHSSHTDGSSSHTDGSSGKKKGAGKKGGYDTTRGKGRGPASLRDVFRDMEDEAASDDHHSGSDLHQ